jgi:hypothetical protein
MVGTRLFLIGGRNATRGADGHEPFVTAVDVFDTASLAWSTLSDAGGRTDHGGLTERSDFACWLEDNGYMVSCTGGYSLDYSQAYSSVISLDTRQASNVFVLGRIPDRPTSSGDNSAQAVGGKVYVFGGFETNDFCRPVGTLEVYDPALKSWRNMPRMVVGRGDMADVAVNGYIFAIGGEGASNCSLSAPTNTVEVFNTRSEQWSTLLLPLAVTRFRFGAAVRGSTVFDIGGQGAADTAAGVYPVMPFVYSLDVSDIAPPAPLLNTKWTRRADMKFARR